MSTSLKNLKKADSFGEAFAFNVSKGVSRFQTNCGAVITFICFAITFLALYIFTAEYLETEKPKVTISSETSNIYPKINLIKNEFMPILVFVNNNQLVPASMMAKFATIVMTKVTYEADPANPTKGKITPYGNINFVDCRSSKIEKGVIDRAVKESGTQIFYDFGFTLCPETMKDDKFWEVEGAGTNLPYAHILLRFYPCSLPDSTQCATLPELLTMETRFSTLSRTYKLSEKENPIKTLYFGDRLIFGFNQNTNQQFYLGMKKVQIFNEDKDFADAKLHTEFFAMDDTYSFSKYRDGSIHCLPTALLTGTCPSYVDILLKSGSKIETVSRIYPKLFNTISELGGFSDLVFLIAGFAYAFYNSHYYNKWLKKKLLSKKDQETCQKFAKKFNRNVSQEKFKEAAEEFIEGEMSGIDLVKSKNISEAICASMSPQHARVFSVLPFLKKFDTERKKEMIRAKSMSLKDCIAHVLRQEADNEFELLIRNEISRLFGGNPYEEKVQVVDLNENYDEGTGQGESDGIHVIQEGEGQALKTRKKGVLGKSNTGVSGGKKVVAKI